MSTNTLTPRGLFRAFVFFCAVLTLPGPLAAQSTKTVDLYRIPDPRPEQLDDIAKNLARWHMGASLILVKDDQFQRVQVPDVAYFEESILLSDNSALTYKIGSGPHHYIIDLGQFMRVSRFFLNNQSAAGDFQILKSDTLEDVESSAWIPLTKEVAFGAGDIPSVKFPEMETRFILVRFDISKAGKIGNFGATGPLSISEAGFNIGKSEEDGELTPAPSPVIEYNFASACTGTRIAYISGGPINEIFNLLDEDPTTTYAFPAGEECFMILDMKKATKFRSFAAQYSTQSTGLVQVYFVDHLPSHFDDAESATGVATYNDAAGMIRRAEFAANGNHASAYLAAYKSKEVVQVPLDYFSSIEDFYSVRVAADTNRSVQVFDELERRYAIFRFVPEGTQQNATIQTAVYRPGQSDFRTQAAQAQPGIVFSSIEVMGDVPFDDLIFTMEPENATPGGPPEDPPDDPPVLSE